MEKNNLVISCALAQKQEKFFQTSLISPTKFAMPIVALLCLTACSPYMDRIPMDINQRETIHKSDEILSSSKKIKVEELKNPNVSYPAAGGAIGIVAGALINSAITNNAAKQSDKTIAPLQHNLIDYHFNKLMNQSLTKSLGTVKWLHLNKKQLTRELSEEQKINLTNEIKKIGDALIYVDLSYKLSAPSMATMIITAKVQIYKKESSKAVVIYKNTFDYIEQAKRSRTPQEYINIWSADNGAKARKSMNSAIKLLSPIIVKDILDPSIKPDNNLPTNIWYSRGSSNNANLAAYNEEKIGNKYVIRTSDGNIVIANKQLVTRKYNWRE